jgi:hypothetical protein
MRVDSPSTAGAKRKLDAGGDVGKAGKRRGGASAPSHQHHALLRSPSSVKPAFLRSVQEGLMRSEEAADDDKATGLDFWGFTDEANEGAGRRAQSSPSSPLPAPLPAPTEASIPPTGQQPPC